MFEVLRPVLTSLRLNILNNDFPGINVASVLRRSSAAADITRLGHIGHLTVMIANYHSMLCYQLCVNKASAVTIFDLLHEKRISKFQLYTYYDLVKRRFK